MRYEGIHGATGGIIESQVFGGIVKINKETPDYRKFSEALSYVKTLQPFEDPSDPDPQFANDLHASIAEILGIEDYTKLKFYTAVSKSPHKKTSFDFHHGVDAFFEYETDEGKIKLVTMDVTTREKEYYKAHILIQVPPEGLDPKEDREEYLELINQSAEAIVQEINNE